MRHLVFRLLGALMGLFAAVALVGCEHDAVPPLVEVTELAPRAIEVGERLDVRGSGFPQGRAASVTFDGTLYRAGEPSTSMSIDVEGTVATSERVEIAFREALEEDFCGRGDHATHATFVGDVEVAFASKNAGAPPLVGTLRGVTLDVRPMAVRASVLHERAAEGARVLGFLGIVTGAPTPRGLPIEEVKAGSLADQSGIRAGDVLVAVDGVHALGLEDVLPSSSRSTRLMVRRGDDDIEDEMTLPMTGYAARRVPRELEPALVAVGLALAALLLLVVPGPRSLTRLEIGLTSRLRSRSRSWSSLLRGTFGGRTDLAVSMLTTAVLASFALGPHVLAPDLDGVVLVAAATSMLAASAASAARGFVATLRDVLEVTACLVVPVLALVGLAILGGAVHLAELVRAQGGAPWETAAAQKPAAMVLACTYCAAVVAVLRTRAPRETRSVRARAFERIGLLCASAVVVAAFFGGWQIPGIAEPRGTWLRAVAATVFVSKTWAVSGALGGIASLATAWTPADARRFALKRLAPALALGAILVVVARRIAPSAAVENAFGAVAFAGLLLLVVRSATRVRTALARREPHASPFL